MEMRYMARKKKNFKLPPTDRPMPKQPDDLENEKLQGWVSEEVPKELRPKGAKVFKPKGKK
jgi:hypothetical protein